MRLSEAHADISVHLMTLNPGPGHGGMSCTSPSKSTFSMAWHHNRNAKNAQSPAEVLLPIPHVCDLILCDLGRMTGEPGEEQHQMIQQAALARHRKDDRTNGMGAVLVE